MDIQTTYQHTLKYAAVKHQSLGQAVPETNLSYAVHLSNVAMKILSAFRHTQKLNLELAMISWIEQNELQFEFYTALMEIKLMFTN